jgi:hypothetical protein
VFLVSLLPTSEEYAIGEVYLGLVVSLLPTSEEYVTGEVYLGLVVSLLPTSEEYVTGEVYLGIVVSLLPTREEYATGGERYLLFLFDLSQPPTCSFNLSILYYTFFPGINFNQSNNFAHKWTTQPIK